MVPMKMRADPALPLAGFFLKESAHARRNNDEL